MKAIEKYMIYEIFDHGYLVKINDIDENNRVDGSVYVPYLSHKYYRNLDVDPLKFINGQWNGSNRNFDTKFLRNLNDFELKLLRLLKINKINKT